ncbi:MAG: hypothetical protein J0M15_10530 [Deltaproteobacteria bacterium]|nr:hypothetical protein [Deltaproteobacteria bacterium]
MIINKRNLLIALNLFTVFIASVSLGENKCLQTYNSKKISPEVLGGVSRIIDTKYSSKFLLTEVDKHFDVKWVTDLGPVLNQKNWGFCHLYSFFEEKTREFRQRNNGKDPNVSIHYMAFHHWLGRAINTALDPSSPLKPQEGGWYIYDIDLFKKIGSMKMDDYLRLGGKTNVEEKLTYFLESSILTSTISKMHDQQNLIDDLFKDEFSDKEMEELSKGIPSKFSPASRLKIVKRNYMQQLFEGENYRRKDEFNAFVKEKEAAFEAKKTTLTKDQVNVIRDLASGRLQIATFSASEIEKIKINVRNDIKKEVTELFSQFFFGKNDVPSEVMDLKKNVFLARSLFPEIDQATISVSVDESQIRYGTKVGFKAKPDFVNNHIYMNASRSVLYELISEEVDKNNGVWVGYDHNDPFVANKLGEDNLGLMSLRAFSWTPQSGYLSRYVRFEKKGIVNGGHAVQIVGIIREKVPEYFKNHGLKGEIIGFIIQNSWGEEAGQKGFYVMDRSYADAFMFEITIRDEQGQVSALKEKMKQYKKQTGLNQNVQSNSNGFKRYLNEEKKIQEGQLLREASIN